jgi:hypothetical protein
MKGAEVQTVATAATNVLIIGNKTEFMTIESTSGAYLDTGGISAVHAGTPRE